MHKSFEKNGFPKPKPKPLPLFYKTKSFFIPSYFFRAFIFLVVQSVFSLCMVLNFLFSTMSFPVSLSFGALFLSLALSSSEKGLLYDHQCEIKPAVL